jgi:hypothetical protein
VPQLVSGHSICRLGQLTAILSADQDVDRMTNLTHSAISRLSTCNLRLVHELRNSSFFFFQQRTAQFLPGTVIVSASLP